MAFWFLILFDISARLRSSSLFSLINNARCMDSLSGNLSNNALRLFDLPKAAPLLGSIRALVSGTTIILPVSSVKPVTFDVIPFIGS